MGNVRWHHRWRIAPAPTALIAVVVTAAAVTGGAVGFGHLQSGAGPACRDVAAAVGLDFRGNYGSVPQADDFSMMSQRNMGNGVAVADYDADGDLDIYLLGQRGHRSRLFRNDNDGGRGRTFRDVTDVAGLGDQTGLSRIAHFVDLRGTGYPDLIVLNDYAPSSGLLPSRLYRNNGDGSFTDATAGSGLDGLTGYIVGGASFADYDGDLRPDLYLSYWAQGVIAPAGNPSLESLRAVFPGRNRLFRNIGDLRFKEVTLESGLKLVDITRDTFASAFADFSGDGRPDIYQTVDHGADLYLENAGNGSFVNASMRVGLGTRPGNGMGVTVADISGDGRLDVFVTHISDTTLLFGSNYGNTLMISSNVGAEFRFENEATTRGVVDTGWAWGTAFVDMDLDGFLDLSAVQGYREHVGTASPALADATARLFRNDGSGNFADVRGAGCDPPGDQRALAVLDYDRDGAPDLLITQVAGPVILLRNVSSDRGNWLTIVPDDRGGHAINARVHVTAGAHTSDQILLAGGSYLTGPPREAYVGLGQADQADEVRIEWADGRTTILRNVRANQVLRVPAPSN